MSALDDLLQCEHSRLHGETLRHLYGRTSRTARERRAREELATLRAHVAALEAEVARLSAAIRDAHEKACGLYLQRSGRHDPICLMYELDNPNPKEHA